jgi:ATP-dependent DNA helicase
LGLPPKKEYVLYAPLSERQKGVYEVVVGGGLRGFLMGKSKKEMQKEDEKQRKKVDVNAPRKLRGGKRSIGDVDGDDDEYFERLENGEEEEERRREKERKAEEIGRDHQYRSTRRFIL